MNIDLNIVSYIIYLPIMVYVTVRVGAICHHNGEIWTMELYHDEEFVKALNRILLLGYYLVNIGYVTLVISFWETILSVQQMVLVIATRIGSILIALALLHYMNIGALSLWYKLKNKPLNTKSHGK